MRSRACVSACAFEFLSPIVFFISMLGSNHFTVLAAASVAATAAVVVQCSFFIAGNIDVLVYFQYVYRDGPVSHFLCLSPSLYHIFISLIHIFENTCLSSFVAPKEYLLSIFFILQPFPALFLCTFGSSLYSIVFIFSLVYFSSLVFSGSIRCRFC